MGLYSVFYAEPVHPSYGRVKQNVDGCLFVWTGKYIYIFLILMSPVRRTAQSALQSALHVMLLSYYIGMCVFHERERDICSPARTRKVSRRPCTCPTTGNILILHKTLSVLFIVVLTHL